MLHTLVSLINQSLPEPHASLLAGMLFGVRRTMPPDFYDALVITGTLHVIALSGMNISIIIRVLFGTLSHMLSKFSSLGITLIAIGGFIWLVGPSATIIRAAIMGSLSLLALYIGRKDVPLISLVVASISMLLISPDLLTNISYQLSVMATLGIILFGGTSVRKITTNSPLKFMTASAIHFTRDNLRVTIAAQIFTAPLILFYFDRISLISPIANLITGWLVAPITYLGFISVALTLLWKPLGTIAMVLVWIPLSLFVYLVSLLATVPFASIEF